MFGRGKKAEQAQAIVRSAAWRPEIKGGETFEFVLDVSPDGGEPFRTTVLQHARSSAHPREGDTVKVSFDPKERDRVHIDLDDDPRFAVQDKGIGLDFIDRQRAAALDIDDLMRTGVQATATIRSVIVADELQVSRSLEFHIDASVQPPDGQAEFTARFPLFTLGPIAKPPGVGEVINVLFDPNDRSKVRNRLMWRQSAASQIAQVRWSVPTECPECGARVDQSVAALAAHPVCGFCQMPLPCTPVAQTGA
jgi:hypothetical protein